MDGGVFIPSATATATATVNATAARPVHVPMPVPVPVPVPSPAGTVCLIGAGGLVPDAHAAVLRALASVLRLKLFTALDLGPRSLADVAAAAGQRPATACRHLRILQRAGLVQRHDQGPAARYQQAPGTPARVGRALCAALLPGRAAAAVEAQGSAEAGGGHGVIGVAG